jgi:hypothetical protein
VDGDDGRVREFTNNSGFAKEACAGIAAGQLGGKELDRHRTVNERIMTTNDATICADA